MSRADDLRALLARVESSTGRDLHIEADMLALFGGPQSGWPREWFGLAYRPTGSVDDALSLIVKMLPRWDVDLHVSGAGLAIAELTGPEFCDADMRQRTESRVQKQPALALIAALLSALITQEVENGR